MENTTRLWDPHNPIDPKNGKPATSEAGRRRAQVADRARAVSLLGWTENDTRTADGRIGLTTGELWAMVAARKAA